MREAVIVSYARTGLAKSARGGFNMTPAMTHGRPRHQVTRWPSRASSPRPSRTSTSATAPTAPATWPGSSGLLAGLPATTAGATIQRHCSSGLNAIALAANYIKQDGADVVVAGGVESISMPNPGFGGSANMDPKLTRDVPGDLHGHDRDRRHRGRALRREPRVPGRVLAPVAAAHGRGPGARASSPTRSCPMATKMKLVNKETKEETIVDTVVDRDECNRPDTTLEGLAKLQAGAGRGQLHHRRQRQPAVRRRRRRGADGGGRGRAPRPDAARRLQGLGRRRLRARRDGHRPGVRRAAACSKRHGLKVDDIDLWELNEAFASQCLYSRDRLGIDHDRSTTSTAARSPSATPSG